MLQPAGATIPASPVARVTHLADGEVRGALLPGGQALLAVADMERDGDGSFGAWLIRLAPGATPQKLLDRCVHASRPLVLPDGRVLVQRGVAGPPPDAIATGELRTDALHVDLFDPESNSTRTVHSWTGYTTFLAGALSDEVFLYRVAHGHADLVAVNVETTAVRVLAAKIPAFARDFSVDANARRLVYTNRDSDGWLIEQLEIDTGTRSLIERVAGMWATPHVWPSGGVLVNDGSGAVVHGGRGVDRPFGAGFDVVSGVADDGSWAVLSHQRPGALPQPFALELASGKLFPVAVGDGLRAQVAGVLP